MMNKQIRIWKEDFFRYYDRTSVMMRIIIGAALSFVLAYLLTGRVIKPQNAQLKTLKQKLQSMEIIDDMEIRVADLKNRQRKTTMQLEGLKRVNAELAVSIGTLSQGEVGKNILDLRMLIDRSSLRIVSEERIVPDKRPQRRPGRKLITDTRVKIKFPSSMSCESYKFKVLGSYSSLRRFFMESRRAQSLFFINNISIVQSKEMLTDRNFNQIRALACSFEVHVPYHSPQKKSGAKK